MILRLFIIGLLLLIPLGCADNFNPGYIDERVPIGKNLCFSGETVNDDVLYGELTIRE